ncbi:MAG: hypothetical protein ACE5J0_01805 [Candidatus Paceibacterales bacterium]
MKKFLLILFFTGIGVFLAVLGPALFSSSLPPGFILPSEFVPPKTGIVPSFPPTPTAFEHFSLRNFMGYPLENLYGFAVLRFVVTSVWFVLAVYFLLRYLRGFYGPRMIPLSWLLLVSGLIITNLAEIGENFVFHEWPYFGILEHFFLLGLPHLWGVILLLWGARLLLKKVKP